MHPFSPKGKLIHFGLEALEKSKHLVQVATKHQPSCLIQPHLYRIALNEVNVQQLQDAALKYPEFAIWLSRGEITNQLGADSMGGLKLSNGCQVIHVPSYLQALWEACENKAKEINGSITWEMSRLNDATSVRLLDMNYDAVIYAAGAGIIQDNLLDDVALPVQLIRGQSLLMNFSEQIDSIQQNEALLCGKYVAPLPSVDNSSSSQISSGKRQFIIGATHEFKSTKLTQDEVFEELKQRSYQLAPKLWDHGVVQNVTSGMRMQSNRGKYGRMPIIGRITNLKAGNSQTKSWVFAGLSSRGLIYHGLFGCWLAEAVLRDDEQVLSQYFEEFDWWKSNNKS
jgi:glycine/D-amino acid oxidase-like deaminating enzyme